MADDKNSPRTPDDAALHFNARILFLSQSPAPVEAVLRGEVVALAQALPLRDDVSTDEITPLTILTHYDEKLGRYPYTGFKAGECLPIAGKCAVSAANARAFSQSP